MENQRGYLSRSWAMLTAEKGWIKPVLVFAAVSSIPVVGHILGSLAFLGYCLEWARLTAWGVDAVPKQRGIKVGEILGSGWRGFCVIFVWGLAGQFVVGMLQSLLNAMHLGALNVILQIALVLVGIVALAAAVRAAIYQKFSAGFGLSQIWDMLRRDARGFLRVAGVRVLGILSVAAVSTIVSMVLFASNFAMVFNMLQPIIDGIRYDYISEYMVADFFSQVLDLFVSMTPVLVLLSFVALVAANVFSLLTYNSVALWMRQFNVPAWGSASDPLPEQASDEM